MGKAEREKGKRGERLLRDLLKLNGFEDARRGQQYSGTETSADVVGVPGLHIECKFVERCNLREALAQAEGDNGDSTDIPVVFHKRERQPWVVCLDATDFLDIYQQYLIVKDERKP